MKKIYVLIATAIAALPVLSQSPELFDFEDILTVSESYENGSNGTSMFNSGAFQLSNNYNASWMSWNGFSISNVTDNQTAGWSNQYASFTGSGHNSTSYGVFYPEGTIDMMLYGTIDSFFVCNTAYAAISMRDGDFVGKQFGSIYNANGEVDGTNGEDFLKVWIIGQGYSSQDKDSIEFFLADFRFSDNAQDYILEEWAKVDLSVFDFDVQQVSFRFESSDVGEWGINTPTYLAIDNIHGQSYGSVNELEMSVDVYPNPVKDILTIKGGEGTVELRSVSGQLIEIFAHSTISTVDMSTLPSGVYILSLANNSGEIFTQKVIR